MLPPEGRVRVVIEGVRPEIDHGAFPAKRIAGDSVIVEADILADGHDSVAGEIVYRHEQEEVWRRLPMKLVGNDHGAAVFFASRLGKNNSTLEAGATGFETGE